MKVIGICGSSGSGKGYVCKLLEKYGLFHIDTDKLYREKTARAGSKCLEELVESIGNIILDENGELNKKELSKIVFEGEGCSQRLFLLNKITHKYILIDTQELIEEQRKKGARGVLIDAPVLFESGFNRICDVTLCVVAPSVEKVQRIIKRDGITMEKAISRLNAQISDEKLIHLCDMYIYNSNEADLKVQIDKIIDKLIN